MFDCLFVSLSLCLSVSLSLCLSVSLSLCLSVSLSLCLSCFMSLSVSLSLCLSWFMSLSVSLSLLLYVSLLMSVCLYLCLISFCYLFLFLFLLDGGKIALIWFGKNIKDFLGSLFREITRTLELYVLPVGQRIVELSGRRTSVRSVRRSSSSKPEHWRSPAIKKVKQKLHFLWTCRFTEFGSQEWSIFLFLWRSKYQNLKLIRFYSVNEINLTLHKSNFNFTKIWNPSPPKIEQCKLFTWKKFVSDDVDLTLSSFFLC